MQSALNRTEFSRMSQITLGKVSKIYPEANMVDILLIDGTILNKVQVMTSYASSRAGIASLPLMKYDVSSLLDKTQPLLNCEKNESDVFAVVAFFEAEVLQPVVLGFLFPEENEILCGRDTPGNEDGTMFLWKHDSNTYVRVAKGTTGESSELEISHPSGFFIKIGKGDKLTPINNYDSLTRPFKSGGQGTPPTVIIKHPSGTSLKIDPDGNISVNCVKNYSLNVSGNYTENIKGSVSRTVGGFETDTIKGGWSRTSPVMINDLAPIIQHNGAGSAAALVVPVSSPVATLTVPQLNTSFTDINTAIAAGDISTVLSGPGSLLSSVAGPLQQAINQNVNLGWTSTLSNLNINSTEITSNINQNVMGSIGLNKLEMGSFLTDWQTNIVDNSKLGIDPTVLSTQVTDWQDSLDLDTADLTSVLTDIKNANGLSFDPATLAGQFQSDNISKLDMKSMTETKMSEFNVSPDLLNNVDSWKNYSDQNSLTGDALFSDWNEKVLSPLGVPEDIWGQVNAQTNTNRFSGSAIKYTQDSMSNVVEGDVLPRNYESTWKYVSIPGGDWKLFSKEEGFY